MSTLQNGFDQGFNEVGAVLGREVGLLRGQIGALLLLTSPTPRVDSATAFRRNRAAGVGASAGANATLPLLAHPKLDEAKAELRSLAKDLDAVTLDKVAEPDYEALQHEQEHAAENGAEGDRKSVV